MPFIDHVVLTNYLSFLLLSWLSDFIPECHVANLHHNHSYLWNWAENSCRVYKHTYNWNLFKWCLCHSNRLVQIIPTSKCTCRDNYFASLHVTSVIIGNFKSSIFTVKAAMHHSSFIRLMWDICAQNKHDRIYLTWEKNIIKIHCTVINIFILYFRYQIIAQ